MQVAGEYDCGMPPSCTKAEAQLPAPSIWLAEEL